MDLQEKIIQNFEGKVVRKDLASRVKGNAVVPTYVLEYLLGQYCAVNDEDIIEAGIEKVITIIKENFVHRDEAEFVKATIREKRNHRIIDKVSVTLNDKKDIYEASFSNLGIKKVPIDDESVKKHRKLLTGGVWCIVTMSYMHTDDRDSVPWIIQTLKPIQISGVDVEEYKALRETFSTEEWIDLLIQSIGLNPEYLTFRDKLIQLSRLIPFCENNYNFIELGPKGTGKSHIFSEFSPHGILLSGGDVTQAKLFVNNSTGQIGLVGFWDTVAFDEFAGAEKRVDRKLVDIMKNYMANKSFSRGRDVYGAYASMAFVGNTRHSVSYMLRHSDLFDALPKAYYDTAFLDRIHFYSPGWEVKKLRNEMFTDGYGFIVDYLAEILREFRKDDFSNLFKDHFALSEGLTTRDLTGVRKTFSGLVKILFPNADCSAEEMKALLEFAMEGRKRVKDQLVKMDKTFEATPFKYTDSATGEEVLVECLENIEHDFKIKTQEEDGVPDTDDVPAPQQPQKEAEELLHGKHLVIKENQKGVSFEKLFAPYLKGASFIHLHDAYLQKPWQIKNLMDFCRMLLRITPPGQEVHLSVITKYDDINSEHERITKKLLNKVAEAFEGTDLTVEIEFDLTPALHARSIETDTGWKISLDRGLDIFQPYDMNDAFSLEQTMQEARACRKFEVTYLRVGEETNIEKQS